MRSGYCQQAESMWTGRATSIVLHSMLHQSVCPVSVPAPFIPWPLCAEPPNEQTTTTRSKTLLPHLHSHPLTPRSHTLTPHSHLHTPCTNKPHRECVLNGAGRARP